jgi:hypothetical protein
MAKKIEIPQLPKFRHDSPDLVKILDKIRYEINETDKTGELFEFYWFAREYPRFYRYHFDHLEHRLKSIHKNYRLIADDMEKSLKESPGLFSVYNINVLKVYWDFEAFLMAINSALELLARIIGTAFENQTPISFNKLCRKSTLHGPVDILRKAKLRWVNKQKDYRDCFVHYTPVDYLVHASLIEVTGQLHLHCRIPVNPNIRTIEGFKYSKRTELLKYSITIYRHLMALDRAVAKEIKRIYRNGQYPKRIDNLFFIGQRMR